MPDKRKRLELPSGASTELKVSTSTWKKTWSESAEAIADNLAKADWQPLTARPRGDLVGYFVILRWYPKQSTWVPLYMEHGSICSRLSKVTSKKEALRRPITNYLSSFPRSGRNLLWVKWLPHSASGKDQERASFEEVLTAFSTKYNHGETLPFNMEEDTSVPENFSILDP